MKPAQDPTNKFGKARLRGIPMFLDIIFKSLTLAQCTPLNTCPVRLHAPYGCLTVWVKIPSVLRLALIDQLWLSTSDNNKNNNRVIIYVILDLETQFVYIRTVTLYWFSEEILLSQILHLNQRSDNSRGILVNEIFIILLWHVKLIHYSPVLLIYTP